MLLANEMNEKKIVDLLSDLKHRIFPRPFERLGVSGKKLIGVEIGVYKADHAESLLRNLDIKHLFLVDPYEMYGEYNEGRDQYGVDQDPLHLAREQATERLARYDNISWIHKKSSDASDEIPDELDFVYIDGNHEEMFVYEDIVSFYPKIRNGGVIGGHDYYNGFCREHDGVIQAVNKFSTETNINLCVELPDWWITKKSD